MSINFF